MARITLSQLRHSYLPRPTGPDDYVLKDIDLDWHNGGAYALLGPSGCGKSTLLNIISGLLAPSEGRIFFDGRDVTELFLPYSMLYLRHTLTVSGKVKAL